MRLSPPGPRKHRNPRKERPFVGQGVERGKDPVCREYGGTSGLLPTLGRHGLERTSLTIRPTIQGNSPQVLLTPLLLCFLLSPLVFSACISGTSIGPTEEEVQPTEDPTNVNISPAATPVGVPKPTNTPRATEATTEPLLPTPSPEPQRAGSSASTPPPDVTSAPTLAPTPTPALTPTPTPTPVDLEQILPWTGVGEPKEEGEDAAIWRSQAVETLQFLAAEHPRVVLAFAEREWMQGQPAATSQMWSATHYIRQMAGVVTVQI